MSETIRNAILLDVLAMQRRKEELKEMAAWAALMRGL